MSKQMMVMIYTGLVTSPMRDWWINTRYTISTVTSTGY